MKIQIVFSKLLVSLGLTLLCANAAYAGSSEVACGLFFGRFTPKYATEIKGNPELPTTLLVKGTEATYIRNNVLIGGKAWFGSTRANDNTAGTYYSIGALGVIVGYAIDFSDIDISIGTAMGFGNMSYAAATTSPLIVEASFVGAEPVAQIGFGLAKNFKVSVGGGYQVGYVHDVAQAGPANSYIAKPNSKVTVAGMSIVAKFSVLLQ